MDWKARINVIQEVGQGDMQVGATLADVDEDPRTDYPWAHTYLKEWIEAQSDQQVATQVIADMTLTAQSLASAGARIDQFKAYIGAIIDLDVTV